MYARETTLSSTTVRSRAIRLLALLVGCAVLCFGAVVGTALPANAAGQTISGTVVFPASAPADVRQPLDPTAWGDDRAGVYLTLYVDQPGTVEGWQLGVDDEVSYDPATGAWSISNVPNGSYRLTVNAQLPLNGYAPGTTQMVTVNNADVAVGNTVIEEAGRLRASFGMCGWQQNDVVEYYVENVATGAVTVLEGQQSGSVDPSDLCPPDVAFGNYAPAESIPAGDYISYVTWNGNTSYYSAYDGWSSRSRDDALTFSVQNWSGTWIRSLANAQVAAGTVAVGGTATVGETLSAEVAGWTAGATFTYQWLRGGATISGATGSTYALKAADASKQISVRVTGAKSGYDSKTATSATQSVSARAFDTAPTPTISGVAKVGQKLTADAGTWAPAPDALTYQWKSNGSAIAGATSATYTPTASDTGATLSVSVTAAKAGYVTKSETSAQTAPVVAADVPVKPFPFTDVAPGSTFYTPINWMYQEGFAAKADKFNPTGSTTRGAMATMLMRIGEDASGEKYTPSPSLKLPFKDVSKSDTHYRGIAWLWENGYAAEADAFNATRPMTRGAMATFLYRMEEGAKDKVTTTGTYTDVPASYVHAKGIEWMAAKGYAVSGGANTSYRPSADVTRQAMATMLYRIYK